MSSNVVDVFCVNYTLIDWDAHGLWIEGRSVTEAVAIMRERGVLGEYPGVTQDLLVSDLNDQFRLLAMLEDTLLKVGNYSEQLVYQLDEPTQRRLIDAYYGLDDSLCRDLVGRKLSSRLRKDLDEVAERTGVPLHSCRRQFDALKRVFKAAEDAPGTFLASCRRALPQCVSDRLVEKYAAVVFLGSFKIEVHRKRLNYLGFDAIRRVATHFMGGAWMAYDAESEPSINKEFLSSLKV